MKESPIKMNSAETFGCIKCQSQFTFRHNLSKHIQSVHEGVKYDSNQCDHQATQQSSLKSENSYSFQTRRFKVCLFACEQHFQEES